MASDDRQIYIPEPQIMGVKGADGNYSFRPLEVSAIRDTFFKVIKKLQGGITLSDLTQLTVDELTATTIITQNLYATYGDVAELTVDRVVTGDNVRRYKDSDTSDINYINIRDQHIQFITGSTDGSTAQHTDRDGNLLYWNDANETGMTTTETAFPVTVYSYTELVKAKYGFDDIDGTYVPRITLGAGSGIGDYGKTFIYKETDGFYIDYYNSADGTKYTIKITDSGIDFGGFPTLTADALHNLWVQPDEPSGAKTDDLWVDKDDPSRYDRTEITTTSTHTISATTAEFLEITGSTAITLTIDATAATAGTLLMIKNSSSEIATLVATINGSATNVLYPGEMVRLLWNGTDWRG